MTKPSKQEHLGIFAGFWKVSQGAKETNSKTKEPQKKRYQEGIPLVCTEPQTAMFADGNEQYRIKC